MTGSTSRLLATMVTMFALVGLAACGADPEVVVTESEESVVPTTTDTTPDTAASTTVPTPTEPAVTTPATAAPTTIPTTTPPAVPVGWTDGTFPGTVYPPCCASNWYGEPSPPTPADPAAPLADGLYRLEVTSPWSSTRPDQIDIEVRPFVWCGDLPEGSCELYESYAADELGVGDTVLRSTTVVLDDTVRVGVVGWGDDGNSPQYGNGSDLVALAAAFDAAITAVVAPRLAAGETTFDIVPDLSANPTGGFGPLTGDRATSYEIVFDAGTGPALLLQTVQSWDSMDGEGPAEPILVFQELNPTVLGVEDGVLTLYFYAGFYS